MACTKGPYTTAVPVDNLILSDSGHCSLLCMSHPHTLPSVGVCVLPRLLLVNNRVMSNTLRKRNIQRSTKDRRANNLKKDQAFSCNRRFRPCRRLNNISVGEVHMDTFVRHPSLWARFRQLGYKHRILKSAG